MLEHPGIARSTNLVRLLTFVCEKHFEGKTEELRESGIAIHALGRHREDFDPQVDPIVRVTARTLRQRLAEYYRGEGRTHEVELVLPTGQYVPRFVRREPAGGKTPTTAPEPGHVLAEAPRAAGRIRSLWTAALVVLAAAAGILGFYAGRASVTGAPAAALAACPCGIWGNPVWSEEFDGPAGSVPSAALWGFAVGNNAGWGNAEQEVYCAPGSSSPPPCDAVGRNASLDGNGNLVIEARRQGDTWTSARLSSKGLRQVQYGRVETRMKLPVGAGLWPAFWMLGADIDEVGWPQSGSITVAENAPLRAVSNGLGPTMIRSTLHGPGYFGGTGLWQNYTLPAGGRVDEFHVYGAIWSPELVQFYVDDVNNVFYTVTPHEVPTGGRWVFEHPFVLVLNLAVGGQWPGPPDATTPDPARMVVDYVRYYKPAPVAGPAITASAIAVRAGETASSTVRLTSTLGTGRVSLSCGGAPAAAACTLSPSVADFTNASTQTATLTLSTSSSSGPSRLVAAAGRYRLKLGAVTVSGDRSFADVPVTVSSTVGP